MKKGNRHIFAVAVPVTSGVSESDWKAYIRTAVQDWKGSLSPEDPLFHVESKQIKILHNRTARQSFR